MTLCRRLLLAASLAAGGLVNPLSAAPLPRFGIFVYSSLCTGAEDPGGAEIVLERSATGNVAIYTRTDEGPISAPLLAFGPNVKIDDRSGHITMRFIDPDLGSTGVFVLEGTVTDRAMEVSGITIPRLLEFPTKLPTCRA
jgi:hypothetical protein